CTLGIAERQRGAVIDRRQPAPERDLALEVELLRGLVAGVDAARRLQPLERRLIEREPGRLPLLAIGREAEPGEIAADRLDERLAAPLRVGIVDAQQEPATRLAR